MDLGTFSISLAVRDLDASLAFYEALGFEVLDGNKEQRWVVLRNGEAKVGLFQGMFEDNLITFNPKDVRVVLDAVREAGCRIEREAEQHFVVKDPDGNLILVDRRP